MVRSSGHGSKIVWWRQFTSSQIRKHPEQQEPKTKQNLRILNVKTVLYQLDFASDGSMATEQHWWLGGDVRVMTLFLASPALPRKLIYFPSSFQSVVHWLEWVVETRPTLLRITSNTSSQSFDEAIWTVKVNIIPNSWLFFWNTCVSLIWIY